MEEKAMSCYRCGKPAFIIDYTVSKYGIEGSLIENPKKEYWLCYDCHKNGHKYLSGRVSLTHKCPTGQLFMGMKERYSDHKKICLGCEEIISI